MTREQIKEVCIDEWIWIKYRRYYLELGYKIYKDYKGKKYFVIHPWDLLRNSTVRIKVTYNTGRLVEFRSLLEPAVTGKGNKSNNIGFNKYGVEITKYTSSKTKDGKYYVECTCHHCNNEKFIVLEASILSGRTKSCSCRQHKIAKDIITKYNKTKGCFIKEEHSKESIFTHLKTQAEIKLNQVNFNKQFAKDNKYLCYLTGKHEWGNIHVHHLQGRQDYPHLTYTLSNLICLRKDIHKEFHSLYTNYHNNVSQFYEYLTLKARN